MSGGLVKPRTNKVTANKQNTPEWLSDDNIAAFMAEVDESVAVA